MASATFAFCVFVCVLSLGQARVVYPLQSIVDVSNQNLANTMCTDCTKILDLFRDMISNKNTQELIQAALWKLCEHLPSGPVVNACMDEVKKYLQLAKQYYGDQTWHRETEICMMIGLCAGQSQSKHTLTMSLIDGEVLQTIPVRVASPEVQITPQCTFCLFLINKLESVLPKEKTEESIAQLMERICKLLPKHYMGQCHKFVEKYGKQIVDYLLSSATPHAICTMIGLCLFEETPILGESLPSDCDSCKTVAVLTDFHLGLNATELHHASLLSKICQLHPSAIPQCESFMQRLGWRLLGILGKQADAIRACQEGDFCIGHN